MGKLLGLLLGAFASRAGSIAVEVLAWLGLSIGGYTLTVGPLRSWIASMASGIPQMGIEVLGYLGVDVAITMLLSALAARYAVEGARAVLMRHGGS